MQKTKLLLGIIVILTISFIGFQIFNQEEIAIILRSLILPILTVYYCLKTRDEKSYFFYFLLVYSLSEFMGVFSSFANQSAFVANILYYGGNSLYIIAYLILVLEVLKRMQLKEVFSRFPIHIIILLILDVYSVILVSQVLLESDYFVTQSLDYYVMVVYNASIMILLTATFINYLGRDSKKAMNLLLGAICIVFSEVIQIAYFYVSERNVLSVVYSILLVLGFYFFYIQSSMSYVKEKNYRESFEKLEA